MNIRKCTHMLPCIFNVNSEKKILHCKCMSLSKVHFMPLCFYERDILVPVFTNQKKFNKDFCFYEKGEKQKILFSIRFAVSQHTHTKQGVWRHKLFPWRPHPACQCPAPKL